MKPRKLFVLGSTGSIGVNTLLTVDSLAAQKPLKHAFRVEGLVAGKNIELLKKQIKKYQPKVICVEDKEAAGHVKEQFPKIKAFHGPAGILEALQATPFDICVNSLVGSAGLAPSLKALDCGADLALANKESLIMAGELLLKKVKKQKVNLLPIDSEHSAIFHLLHGRKLIDVERMILTASGGPFFKKPIANPTIAQVLAHPTWKMGKKISVDSATMMNKGLEVIEAHFLFNMPLEKIETIIHPQSIVHSMIETIDGEIYSQLGRNDMRHPIQNALTYPHLAPSPLPRFRLEEIRDLSFFPMDFKQFPMLKVAYHAGKLGGTALVALNAANEAAVHLFLSGHITFADIVRKVEAVVSATKRINSPSLQEILLLDEEIKRKLTEKFQVKVLKS